MDAMTTQQASHDLDGLIDRMIDNVQPTIPCNDKGNKAVLMSLDKFQILLVILKKVQKYNKFINILKMYLDQLLFILISYKMVFYHYLHC